MCARRPERLSADVKYKWPQQLLPWLHTDPLTLVAVAVGVLRLRRLVGVVVAAAAALVLVAVLAAWRGLGSG